MSIDLYVGSRIREKRLELKLTECDLADRIGWSVDEVVKCESGMDRIDPEMLIDLAYTFGVPLSHFFPDKPIGDDGAYSDWQSEAKARSKPS